MASFEGTLKSDYAPLTPEDHPIGSYVYFYNSPERFHLSTQKRYTLVEGATPDIIHMQWLTEVDSLVEIHSPSRIGTVVERDLMDTPFYDAPRFAWLLIEFEDGQRGYVVAYNPAKKA